MISALLHRLHSSASPVPVRPKLAFDRCLCGHFRWQHKDSSTWCTQCGCSYVERANG